MTAIADEFVAFDLETTGLSPKVDRIIEIGAVRFDAHGNPVATLDLLVDPGIPIPLAIQRLVGLSNSDVAGAPTPVEGLAQLADLCEGAHLVGHGTTLDMAFCTALLPDTFGRRMIFDTLDLARIFLPRNLSHSLPLLTLELGLGDHRAHRAYSDADATRRLFLMLAEVAAGLPTATVAEMRRVAAQGGGALEAFLSLPLLSSASPGVSAPRPSSASVPEPRSEAPGQAVPDTPLPEAAARLLAPDGPLAQALPDYEHREAQQQMAVAVAQSLERRTHLLAEAGTGLGKSFAYLVPLALWAQRHQRRAIVATHTVTLQDQLVERDLPAVAELLPETTTFASLKGRSHYLSPARWARFLARPDTGRHGVDLDSVRFKLKLLSWLAQTSSGDRAELHLTSAEEPLWQLVQCDEGDWASVEYAEASSGPRFLAAARRRARAASLVVTTQALLLADAQLDGLILGEHDAVVIDEAHHLEEAATAQLGTSLRASDLEVILERLAPVVAGAPRDALEEVRVAAQRVFGDAKGFVAAQLGKDQPGNAVSGLNAEIRESRPFAHLARSARQAVTALRSAAQLLSSTGRSALVQQPLLADEDGSDEPQAAATALSALAEGIDRVLCNPRSGYVSWIALRAEQAELHEAPVDVSEKLRESVFAVHDSVVLTSATLTVAGSFDFIRQRTGIGERAEEVSYPSPFDFLSQALCIVPTDIPPYDDPAYDKALADVVAGVATPLRGRTLGLFTGYEALRRIRSGLSGLEHEGIAVLAQGLDGTRRQLLRSFLDHPDTVLLGTHSFWEGIDVPGDALSCVVIAKLPFAVPTDPLVAARCHELSDPFSQYILPMAVIQLKQGFGRLIRTNKDRGAVILCDARLSSRQYAHQFFASLPPAAVEHVPTGEIARAVGDFVLSRQRYT